MEGFQSYIGGTPSCPFCRGRADCEHHIGWSDDGVTIDPKKPFPSNAAPRKVLPTDVLVNTGVSTRVYRDWVFA